MNLLAKKWLLTIQQWLAKRSQRELVLVAIGTFFVIAGLFWNLTWGPLEDVRRSTRAELTRYNSLLARAQLSAPQNLLGTVAVQSLPPARAITESANTFGLGIRRLEPEGGATRVVLDDADFANVTRWLAALEQDHALRVTAIEMERRPAPGIVTARILLQR